MLTDTWKATPDTRLLKTKSIMINILIGQNIKHYSKYYYLNSLNF